MKVFTMTVRPGEFWVADIQFTDAAGSKKRPVLILWLDDADVVVAAVTTANPRSVSDIALTDWKASGLVRASTVRLSRLDLPGTIAPYRSHWYDRYGRRESN
jgi:mRNA interferase MazF